MLETQALCIKGARLPHLPLSQFQGNTQWETFLPWFWSRKWENHMVVPRVFVYPRSYVTGFFHRGGGKNDWQDDCGGWARISSLFWAMCGERWLVWLCCLNNPVGFFSFFLEPFLLFIYLLSYVCVCAVCVCMKSVWHIHIWACVCVCCVGMPMRWPWRLEVESKLSCLSFFSILFFSRWSYWNWSYLLWPGWLGSKASQDASLHPRAGVTGVRCWPQLSGGFWASVLLTWTASVLPLSHLPRCYFFGFLKHGQHSPVSPSLSSSFSCLYFPRRGLLVCSTTPRCWKFILKVLQNHAFRGAVRSSMGTGDLDWVGDRLPNLHPCGEAGDWKHCALLLASFLC